MHNIFLLHLLSALGGSILGSFIIWLILNIFSSDSGSFSIILYVSIFLLSAVVIFLLTMLIYVVFKPVVLLLADLTSIKLIAITSLSGGMLYLTINSLIILFADEDGIFLKFLLTGAFVYPFVIGAIYGCAYGVTYIKFR